MKPPSPIMWYIPGALLFIVGNLTIFTDGYAKGAPLIVYAMVCFNAGDIRAIQKRIGD